MISAAYRWPLIMLGAVLLFCAPLLLGDFSITLMNYIGIYTLVALGLVLLTGCGGLTSFGQAAFVGLGAYATAYLTTAMGLSPWLGLAFAVTISVLIAVFLGFITLNLGGHYLPLSTIAWGLAIYLLFGNFEVLGRYGGISGIPPVSIGNTKLETMRQVYFLVWGITFLCLLMASNLLRSRQGRAIRALRGGKHLSESIGISTFWVRLAVFVIAAALAAIAGWLYAHMQKFVSPAPFDLRAGIEFLLMAVLGGSGFISGALVGAAAVALIKNWLQDLLPYVTSNSGNLEIVVFGCLFILLLHYSRGGIVPLVLKYLPRFTVSSSLEKSSVDKLPKREQPATGMQLLTLEGVSRNFGGLKAVSDVSFSVKAGELVALIGPNGAGKSTTFNLITKVTSLSGGAVRFSGENLMKYRPCELPGLGIARTFQHVKLRPTMSVIENVMLGSYSRTTTGFARGALALSANEEAQVRALALEQLKNVGLLDRANWLAGNLALGQQRLVEIARAMATDPVILMLDEPAAGLRAAEKAALSKLLNEFKSRGLTILLVEHDMEFVMGLADRIVVLDFGKKLIEGTPKEVRESALVQEAYLGSTA